MKALFLVEPQKSGIPGYFAVACARTGRSADSTGSNWDMRVRCLLLFGPHNETSYPHLLGHEFVGRVVAKAKDVDKFAIGERVIVEPNYPCGSCHFCLTGRGCICPNKKSMGVTAPDALPIM